MCTMNDRSRGVDNVWVIARFKYTCAGCEAQLIPWDTADGNSAL